nr:hypothetical protein [uncultured Caproiciproducens sp.]
MIEKEILEKIRKMLRELGWSDEVINNSEYFRNDANKVRAIAQSTEQGAEHK